MPSDKSKKLIYLEKILRVMSVLVLKKYQPKIIGITGSMGKTSAKEAVFAVLSSRFSVRRNEKNYNNEIGLPLTIIGAESGESSFWGWLKVFMQWAGMIMFPVKYPEILVLELAADHPGDIKYLVDFIKPSIGIITDISMSHLEFFKNIENIAKEKGELVKKLERDELAILNIDNQQVAKIKNQLKCRTMTFGFFEEAQVRASDVFYNYTGHQSVDNNIKGLSFKLTYKGTTMPMRLNNVLAKHNIYPAMAAIAIGIELGLNLVEIGQALENFALPSGRMNILAGIKNSLIIDDTYNASSPHSVIAAVAALENIEAPRKIIVLGDMLELGEDTESAHREVAKRFLRVDGAILLAVGERMMFALEELKKHKLNPDRVYHFSSPMKAGAALQKIIKEGDLILVKGSQGMRMEKVVEEVMAEPEKASELLCRQSESWKQKPWQPV